MRLAFVAFSVILGCLAGAALTILGFATCISTPIHNGKELGPEFRIGLALVAAGGLAGAAVNRYLAGVFTKRKQPEEREE